MSSLLAAVLSAASAAPGCAAAAFATPPEALSVAWVSPLRERAGRWIDVVPTSELSSWIASERPSLGRTLQHLGERRRDDDPGRRWKVTVFDVRLADLCRPIDTDDLVVDGMAVCSSGAGGCGYAVDRADGERSLDVWRIRWADAAPRGFCVFPADRFVAEAAGTR